MNVNIVIEKVRFSETDMMGVVHHANYLRWMEIGRVEFLRALGIELLDLVKEDILFPIVDVSCQYYKSAHFDDEILIETALAEFSKIKLEFVYKIYKKEQEKQILLAEGKSKNVYIDKAGKVIRLPQKYYGKIIERH